jgi:hypothetical protein
VGAGFPVSGAELPIPLKPETQHPKPTIEHLIPGRAGQLIRRLEPERGAQTASQPLAAQS